MERKSLIFALAISGALAVAGCARSSDNSSLFAADAHASPMATAAAPPDPWT